MQKIFFALSLFTFFFLTSCSYNPFVRDNNTTGSPYGVLAGAAIGGGGAAIFDSSKPIIGLSAVAGGAIGYYMTTLRYNAGGVYMSGGKVYKVGDFVGIYIPSGQLFEPHSTDFLPEAAPILDSAATILKRYPNNDILISGSTNGFYRPRFEQKLSQAQAEKVAAYLWRAGINNFSGTNNMKLRRLQYIGYGDYFPIASNLTLKGVYENNRIQITSYPSNYNLQLDSRHRAFNNMGTDNDYERVYDCGPKGEC